MVADAEGEAADTDADPTSHQPGVQLADAAWARFVQRVRSDAAQVKSDNGLRDRPAQG